MTSHDYQDWADGQRLADSPWLAPEEVDARLVGYAMNRPADPAYEALLERRAAEEMAAA